MVECRISRRTVIIKKKMYFGTKKRILQHASMNIVDKVFSGKPNEIFLRLFEHFPTVNYISSLDRCVP